MQLLIHDYNITVINSIEFSNDMILLVRYNRGRDIWLNFLGLLNHLFPSILKEFTVLLDFSSVSNKVHTSSKKKNWLQV